MNAPVKKLVAEKIEKKARMARGTMAFFRPEWSASPNAAMATA